MSGMEKLSASDNGGATHRVPIMWLAALLAAAYAPGAGAAPAPPADPVPQSLASGFSMPIGSLDLMKINDVTDRQRAEAKLQSRKLMSAVPMSCDLRDAALVGRGKSVTGGRNIDVEAYEIACSNRTGYILVSQGAARPLVTSCFAADAAHAAAGRPGDADLYCRLPANRDVKVMAAALLSGAGNECTVAQFRWFGLSASSLTDYSEVACADGRGYLIKIPASEPSRVSVLDCEQAAREGLTCHLTYAAPVAAPVTLQTFRDALERHDAACTSARVRVIGRESVDKRYVVEFRCPASPGARVAFIPLGDNVHPFETIDCPAAAERQINCELAAN